MCHEDYKWWWNCFWIGACPAVYLLIESFIKLMMNDIDWTVLVALLIVDLIMAISLALIGGSIAFCVGFKYVSYMFGQIKQN